MDMTKLESYYSEVSGFTKLLCDTWHMMENADDLENAELACINEKLYEQIRPDRYEQVM